MATVTTTYDISDPEDACLFVAHNQATDMISAIWDFDQYLRAEIKYKDAPKVVQDIRDVLWGYLNDYKVNIDL